MIQMEVKASSLHVAGYVASAIVNTAVTFGGFCYWLYVICSCAC